VASLAVEPLRPALLPPAVEVDFGELLGFRHFRPSRVRFGARARTHAGARRPCGAPTGAAHRVDGEAR
jgi:hypothetical protein